MEEVAERTCAGAAVGRAHDAHAQDGHARRRIASREGTAVAARQPRDDVHLVAADRHARGQSTDDLPHPARVLVVRAVDRDSQGVLFLALSERARIRCESRPHSRNGAPPRGVRTRGFALPDRDSLSRQ